MLAWVRPLPLSGYARILEAPILEGPPLLNLANTSGIECTCWCASIKVDSQMCHIIVQRHNALKIKILSGKPLKFS